MRALRVLVLGDVMRDIIVRAAGPLRRGTDQHAVIRMAAGGSGANQAAWLAHFGVPVRFLGCVGREDHAAETARLREAGVEPMLAPHPDLPTGTLIAMVDPDGERSFLTDRGANDELDETALNEAVLDGVGHVHLSGYAFVGDRTRATALALLEHAARAKLPVSIDAGSSAFIETIGADLFLRWAGGRALFVANAAEAEVLTGSSVPQQQIGFLARHFDLVLLKRGPEGARARTRGGEEWTAAAPMVDVVDTIGAGDAFLAAFLAAQFAGSPPAACLTEAVRAGADAVGRPGGRPESRPGCMEA